MKDQVTIINSTLGKALGGASGAYRVVPWGPLILMQGPRGVSEGGEGTPGTADKRAAWTLLSGGA